VALASGYTYTTLEKQITTLTITNTLTETTKAGIKQRVGKVQSYAQCIPPFDKLRTVTLFFARGRARAFISGTTFGKQASIIRNYRIQTAEYLTRYPLFSLCVGLVAFDPGVRGCGILRGIRIRRGFVDLVRSLY